MKKNLAAMLLFVAMTGLLSAAENVPSPLPDTGPKSRYLVCDNHQGGFLFWVDSTNGKVWRLDWSKEKMFWRYLGQLPNVQAGESGTYVPYPNKSGGGLFILNPATGEGWYCTGNIGKDNFRPLGKPVEQQLEK